MSILLGKKILIPEAATEQLRSLQKRLEEAGAQVLAKPVNEITEHNLKQQEIDVLLLDFVANEPAASQLLAELQDHDETRTLPVFAIVKGDTGSMAEEVLASGAADFITELDDTKVAITKIKTMLGEPNTLSNASHVIDITPEVVRATDLPMRVFFVEDDALLRNLLEAKFQESGITCEFSKDGKNVPALISEFKPQVIILDIMLPGINGLEILEQLTTSEATKDIPVLIFSNRDEQADRQRATDLGAAGFYVKALTDLSDLVKNVQKFSR